ncbi:unnamed protein product [Arctogadus glacialis]
MGNTRTRLRGLRKLWAETLTIALLDQEEEKPLGRLSGLNPVPGQTAPDRGQTTPDRGQTAPDRGQTAPDHGQTAPDHGQTASDRGRSAPDRGRTAPDRGQTAPDQVQTPDEPENHETLTERLTVSDSRQGPQKGPVPGPVHTRIRLRGLRKLWAETSTIALLDPKEKPLGRPSGLNPFPGQTAPDQGQTAPDRGQTAPDQGQTAPDQVQTPDEPADRALRKDLSQVIGNTRIRLRGLRKLWAETRTIALLDQEEKKPLGRLSGLNPFPGQTAPDRGQTAPDRGKTAPDRGRTAPDRGQTAPDQGQTAPDQGQTAFRPEPLGTH